MSVIVKDHGFTRANDRLLAPLAEAASATEIDLANTDDPTELTPYLDRITLIRVAVPSFADGRGFTIGRRLRMAGYKGELIALGPVIADQFPMLRRIGFDGVEIPDDMAERQPEAQWKFRADWQAHHYQAKLRA